MNCLELFRIVDSSDVNKLSVAERSACEAHASTCRQCAPHWIAFQSLAEISVPSLPSEVAMQCETLAAMEARSASRRSHYILVGMLVAVSAAAAGLWVEWGGGAPPEQEPPIVENHLAPGSATPPPPAVPARLPIEGPVPEKASEREPAADKCCVPAIPGIESYWVPASSSYARFSIALGEEEKDLAWASDMERRLKEALKKVDDLRDVHLEMVCRSTACGLLFIFSQDDDVDALGDRIRELKRWARDELGFTYSGTIGMQPGGGKRYMVLNLAGAQGQVKNHPAAAAAMSAVLAPAPLPPDPQIMGAFTDPGVRATERLALEPADRSTATVTLENEIQREALAMVGTRLNRLTVECRVATCVVVVGFPSGVSPDLSPMIARISRLVGPATIANMSKLSGPDGDTAAIELKR